MDAGAQGAAHESIAPRKTLPETTMRIRTNARNEGKGACAGVAAGFARIENSAEVAAGGRFGRGEMGGVAERIIATLEGDAETKADVPEVAASPNMNHVFRRGIRGANGERAYFKEE